MRDGQATKHTRVRACVVCGRRLLHHQVVSFDRVTGTKSTSFTPTKHRCKGSNAHDRTTR